MKGNSLFPVVLVSLIPAACHSPLDSLEFSNGNKIVPSFTGFAFHPSQLPIQGGTMQVTASLANPDGVAVALDWKLEARSGGKNPPVLLEQAGNYAKFSFPSQVLGENNWNLKVEAETPYRTAASALLSISSDGQSIVFPDPPAPKRTPIQQATISTVVGTGAHGYSGDHGPAKSAQVGSPRGLTFAPDGTLYFIDSGAHTVRKVDPSGIISTAIDQEDRLSIKQGRLQSPESMAIDQKGNLIVLDVYANVVVSYSPSGEARLIAGTGERGFSQDGTDAKKANLTYPKGLVIGDGGQIFFAEGSTERVRTVDSNGALRTVAGNGLSLGYRGPSESAVRTHLYRVDSLVRHPGGDLLFSSPPNIFRLSTQKTLQLVAGDYYGTFSDGMPAIDAKLDFPKALTFDHSGHLFFSEGNRIYKIDESGRVTIVAGNGIAGYGGDGGPPHLAQLNGPSSLAFDRSGNLFVSETSGNRIRKITFR